MTHGIEPFFNLFKMTQRVEVFFQYDSKNWTFLFFQNAQRIEPLFHLNYFFTWLNELNFFSQFDSKFFLIWLKELDFFLNMTRRIEPFFEHDSKELNLSLFLIWLEDLNLFFEYDSKNWFFVRNLRLKVKESNLLFFNTTQRIEHLFLHVTHVLIWFQELIFFLVKNFSKNIFFIWLKEWYLTQRLEIYLFQIWFKELDFFFLMTRRLEAFFFFQKLWRKEFFWKNMTQRIEPFLSDSKNWTLLLWIWRRELNLSVLPQRIEFFSQFWLEELSHFFWIGLKELNYFNMTYRIEPLLFFTNMIQRIEPCVKKKERLKKSKSF